MGESIAKRIAVYIFVVIASGIVLSISSSFNNLSSLSNFVLFSFTAAILLLSILIKEFGD